MFWAALHMVISDFKVFIVFVAPFPQVHLSVGEGGGGGQQAFSLSSKHKLSMEFPQVLPSTLYMLCNTYSLLREVVPLLEVQKFPSQATTWE